MFGVMGVGCHLWLIIEGVALPLGVALNNEAPPFPKLLGLKEATIGQSQLGPRFLV
jgi:hypothetical protein